MSETGKPDPEPKSGSAILFLHGRFGMGWHWQKVIDRLADRYHCFAPDLPGFGSSVLEESRALSVFEHAQLARNLVTRLTESFEDVFVVGHDIGGSIALICATFAAPRISGLVLINCAGLGAPASAFRTGWFGFSSRRLFSRAASASRHLSPVDRRELMAPWRAGSSRSAIIRAFRAIESSWPGPLGQESWERKVSALQIPVLVLKGSRDPVNRREVDRELLRQLPGALYFEEESCGHWPALERPEWVAPKLREFFFNSRKSYGHMQ
ncbi:MAG: alpha/beta hydrolase [Oligoflexia bacterium]|nr:alpha/beta hydrolase [Oligoflexia bacterium]